MKIKGTGAPSGITPPVDTGRALKTRKGEFAPKVDAARAQPPAPARAADATRAIAADLRAGRIDAKQAIERLVDDAVARVGRDVPASMRARLRAELLAIAADDPMLSAKLKRFDR